MFDTKAFMKKKYEHRTQEIELKGLDTVIRVRGLTGEELGKVNSIVANRGGLEAIVNAIAQGETAEAFKVATGLNEDMPEDGVKRIEYLKMGTVEPEITQEIAVKMYRVCPVDVYKATNAILRMTGQGMQEGE